jgi:integrase
MTPRVRCTRGRVSPFVPVHILQRTSTWASYEAVTTLCLIPALGRVPLAKLQPEHVSRMLRDVAASAQRPARPGKDKGRGVTPPKPRTLSPTTVRYCYSVLRIALGRAVKLGKVHRNVATLIDPPARARRELQPLDGAQVRQLTAALEGHPMALLFRTAVMTGMRQGEVLALRWQDLGLDAGELTGTNTLTRIRELAAPKTARSRRTIRSATDVSLEASV